LLELVHIILGWENKKHSGMQSKYKEANAYYVICMQHVIYMQKRNQDFAKGGA